jgi:hypothetical protein
MIKRSIVFVAIFALSALAVAAQDKVVTPNFSGTWTLDVQRSQLGERNNIESQELTVKQTDKTFDIATSTKRTQPPAVTPGGMPAGRDPGKGGWGSGMGAGRSGGAFGGGDTPATYSLDGKDTKSEMQGPMGPIPVTLNAKFDGAKLNLSRSSSFTTARGEMTMSTKETWEILSDGKTLRVDSERTSMRGTESTIRIYTRKDQK